LRRAANIALWHALRDFFALLEALFAKHVLIDFTVSFTFGTIKSATL
jgi:hypothetical protein